MAEFRALVRQHYPSAMGQALGSTSTPNIARTARGTPYLLNHEAHFSMTYGDRCAFLLMHDLPVGVDLIHAQRQPQHNPMHRFLRDHPAHLRTYRELKDVQQRLVLLKTWTAAESISKLNQESLMSRFCDPLFMDLIATIIYNPAQCMAYYATSATLAWHPWHQHWLCIASPSESPTNLTHKPLPISSLATLQSKTIYLSYQTP